MLDRVIAGTVPAKPHLVFRSPAGAPYYEECLTRSGFEGAYSILYHQHRPHEATPGAAVLSFRVPSRAAGSGPAKLLRRHYRCPELPATRGAMLACRIPLLFNDDVVIGFAQPDRSDPAYLVNADADELFFVQQGRGLVRSFFGDLSFVTGDYVVVPKGVPYRMVFQDGMRQELLTIECLRGLGLPTRYRNPVGQLRMDAPYSHRDFRRPEFGGPRDEGIRDLVVKRGHAFYGFRSPHPPLDVIGWDGAVYPFALPILAFQPRVGQVHLPPSVHGTFEAGGALICSFVPRPLDFHREANPCPYPHSSVDIDEVLFYANTTFGSRRGVGAASLSHHPAGIAHGPHPGAYEAAHGKKQTDELAVMLDCSAPLWPTADALGIEDPEYHQSFSELGRPAGVVITAT